MASKNDARRLANAVKVETKKALKAKPVKAAVRDALAGGAKKSKVRKIIATAAKKEASKIVRVGRKRSVAKSGSAGSGPA